MQREYHREEVPEKWLDLKGLYIILTKDHKLWRNDKTKGMGLGLLE